MTTARTLLLAGVASALIATVTAGCSDEQPEVTPTASGTASSQPAGEPQSIALAVKIDNVSAARPQTGIGMADIIYIEPVEGGLTRMLAVYQDEFPTRIGPVRSGRRTDVGLLAQFGKPIFTYSGAAPHLLPVFRDANIVNASPQQWQVAYKRDHSRPVPHNLYLNPSRLPGGAQPPGQPVLEFGPAPAGGTNATRHQISYSAASYSMTWVPGAERWQLTMDGSPVVSTGSGRVSATTVVEQRVPVRLHNGSPIAKTVGKGKATVLRDGKRFEANWSRQKPTSPTRFTTPDGKPLPLAEGPVWIFLVPA